MRTAAGAFDMPDGRAPLIVVVDDDASMASALRRLLGAAGFRVQVFDRAEAAGLTPCAAGADCLVLDLKLPGIGGAEYYSSLASPRPPAIFITAHDGPAARGSARDSGAHAYLTKPFGVHALLAAVRSVVRDDG